MHQARAKISLAPDAIGAASQLPTENLNVASVVEIDGQGMIHVRFADGHVQACAWLERGNADGLELASGDTVLVIAVKGVAMPVVVGRVGRVAAVQPRGRLKLEATESIELVCGESSIDLRADGKVMIRGEDVLVRAKGTKRIRAGTVSIN